MEAKSSFLGLRTVIYGVNDIEKAKKWYESALNIKPYFDEPYYVGFTVGGFELGLDPNAKPIGNISAGVVAYWRVLDIDVVFEKLISLGATEYEKPHDVGEGIKVATVVDPFSNILGLIYNPNFKM